MSFPIQLTKENALEIKAGDTFSQTYRIKVSVDNVITPVDFEAEGWENWVAILQEYQSDVVTTFDISVSTGELTISLTATQTAAIKNPARFEISATRGTEVRTWIQGPASFIKEL